MSENYVSSLCVCGGGEGGGCDAILKKRLYKLKIYCYILMILMILIIVRKINFILRLVFWGFS